MSASVLRQLFDVKGKGLLPIPSPFPCLQRLFQSTEVDRPKHRPHGSENGPTPPSPKSQSLSLSYGPNLPTSLTYILAKTRGFEPWRPAAVIGTSRGANKTLTQRFKARHQRTGHPKTWTLYQLSNPIAGQTNSRVSPLLKRKENSFRGQCRSY